MDGLALMFQQDPEGLSARYESHCGSEKRLKHL
jgi:hypothetical protein